MSLQYPPKRLVTVQCLAGHVYSTNEPELIVRATKRAAKGFLDALILSPSDCEECIEVLRRRNASYAMYDMELD